MTKKLALMGFAIGFVPLACTHARGEMMINGAGSTFGYPLYSNWFDTYTKVDPNVRFNYQSIGSGGGIDMLISAKYAAPMNYAPLPPQVIKLEEAQLNKLEVASN